MEMGSLREPGSVSSVQQSGYLASEMTEDGVCTLKASPFADAFPPLQRAEGGV